MRTSSVAAIIALSSLWFAVLGCGAGVGTSAPTQNPQPTPTLFAAEGVFTRCAFGTAAPNGDVFLNGGGFLPGSMSIKREASKVTASITSDKTTTSLDFRPQGPLAASLASGGTVPGFAGLCVRGPGHQRGWPATLTAEYGSLVYSSRTAFLTVNGVIEGTLGPCGAVSSHETWWVVCGEGPPGIAGEAPEHPASGQLPPGSYSCSSFIDTFSKAGAQSLSSVSGGAGQLTLTGAGSSIVLSYAGDALLKMDALGLTWVGAGAAVAKPGQSLGVTCDFSGAPSEELPITAASVSASNMAVSFSFLGTMGTGSACAGTQMVGNVTCYRN